jgi:hypothetical protein
MAKRRRSTRAKRQRGGFIDKITTAISDAATNVGNAISGNPVTPTTPPATVAENVANTTTGTPAATVALNEAQNVADKLPSVANSNASASLGLPPPAPGTTSTGGRRRRSRKTKRRTQRHGGKYY